MKGTEDYRHFAHKLHQRRIIIMLSTVADSTRSYSASTEMKKTVIIGEQTSQKMSTRKNSMGDGIIIFRSYINTLQEWGGRLEPIHNHVQCHAVVLFTIKLVVLHCQKFLVR
jgi:hypothetical protein